MDIRIEKLCISYGNQRVIDSLSLDIAPGAFFTLLGPSGCGKTTLLRAIAGFTPIASGHLLFGGRDVTRLPAHQRNIGMVFQDYALFPNRSVYDNAAYGLRARKVAPALIQQRVASALDRVGLGQYAARLPAELSGGQRQRVALARALVIQPQVLLMDEPLSNLDAKLRIQVRQTIAELQREAGITTVFVTHDQEEALALSDQIAVMQQGRVAQLGTPRDIYSAPASGYVADFIGAANLLPVQCHALETGPVQLQVDGHAVAAHAPVPVAGQAVLVARPEDIMLSTTPGAGVPARILAQQYLGIKTNYRVELPSGRHMNVDVHGDPIASLARGTKVDLVFNPQKTLVLAS
ncbi:ABC transporter ATP-binding protein [Achromobacter sp. AGC78]|uniref:ABC transporter ATP-binding protein n=1 Tax=Achromobacter sp. JUb104 TaxID=2940590 RepID=UPI00216A90EA|nr:ABC transporter ATP-binding protein [Achromobacter sp. JUb104]MCS3508627.1 iron(III) transport system ATP-binding protein [Achromobacter sp. JUb104]